MVGVWIFPSVNTDEGPVCTMGIRGSPGCWQGSQHYMLDGNCTFVLSKRDTLGHNAFRCIFITIS